jgi:hypothetical protein
VRLAGDHQAAIPPFAWLRGSARTGGCDSAQAVGRTELGDPKEVRRTRAVGVGSGELLAGSTWHECLRAAPFSWDGFIIYVSFLLFCCSDSVRTFSSI